VEAGGAPAAPAERKGIIIVFVFSFLSFLLLPFLSSFFTLFVPRYLLFLS
jgi:hypothetical protein